MYLYIKEGSKKRKAQEVVCDECNKSFLKQSRFIEEDKNNFCSRDCSANFRKKRILVKCDFCNKDFQKQTSKVFDKNYCSVDCKNQDAKNSKHYRIYALREKPNECIRCGYNQNMLALDVHHIDRDRSNNDLSNLEILCANCHAIEHRKNKS